MAGGPSWHFETHGGGHHDFLNDVWKEVYQRKNMSMYRGLMRRAVPFTLDTASTRLVTELATQSEKCDLYRTLARLPYEVVWLEYDYQEKVRTQIKLGTRKDPYSYENEPNKMGYLIERLTETRWRVLSWVSCTITSKNKSIYSVVSRSSLTPGEEVVETMPPAFILDTEGSIQGYRTTVRDPALLHAVQATIDNDDAPCAVAWGLGLPTPGGVFAFHPKLLKSVCIDLPPDWEVLMGRDSPRPHERRDLLQSVLPATMKEQSGLMRWLCAALASITSAPTILTERKKQGTFRADGRMREYKVNQVVTLHIPGKRTITVKHMLSLFRGAKRRMARHQVHGFWRTTTAEVSPGDRWQWMYSQRHREFRWHIWINDFERGDATLGYVLRNYEVTT
jgi:hypothetical protein